MKPLRLTPIARSDLRTIYREGVRLFGEVQARRYFNLLTEELRFIEAFPLAVRLRDEFVPAVRIHPAGAHVIIFDVMETEIIVARIRHGREDWKPNI